MTDPMELVERLEIDIPTDLDAPLKARHAIIQANNERYQAAACIREMVEWRPIETAPRDGTKIDVWHGGERMTDVYWSDIQDAWCFDGLCGPEEPTPLAALPPVRLWLPLPPAPGAEA